MGELLTRAYVGDNRALAGGLAAAAMDTWDQVWHLRLRRHCPVMRPRVSPGRDSERLPDPPAWGRVLLMTDVPPYTELLWPTVVAVRELAVR